MYQYLQLEGNNIKVEIMSILKKHLCSTDKVIHKRAVVLAASLMTKHNRHCAAEIAAFGLGRLVAGSVGKEEELARVCMRCLAAIAEFDAKSRVLIGKFDPKLTRLIDTLDNDDLTGNAALVVGNCLGEKEINVDIAQLIPKLLQFFGI